MVFPIYLDNKKITTRNTIHRIHTVSKDIYRMFNKIIATHLCNTDQIAF